MPRSKRLRVVQPSAFNQGLESQGSGKDLFSEDGQPLDDEERTPGGRAVDDHHDRPEKAGDPPVPFQLTFPFIHKSYIIYTKYTNM